MIPVLASLIPTIVEKGMDLFDNRLETGGENLQNKDCNIKGLLWEY